MTRSMNMYRYLAAFGAVMGMTLAHLGSAHAICADPPCGGGGDPPPPPPPPLCGPFHGFASDSGSFGDPSVLGAGYSVIAGFSGAKGVARNSTSFSAFADAFGSRTTFTSFNMQGTGGTTHSGSVDLTAMGSTVLSLLAPVNTSLSRALHFYDASANYSVMAWFVPVSFTAQVSLDGQIGLSVAEVADATHAAGTVSPTTGVSTTAKAAICLGGCTGTGLGVGVNGSLQLLTVSMPLSSNATLTGPASANASVSLAVGGSAMSGTIGYSVFGCLLGACGTFASGNIASWPGSSFNRMLAGGNTLSFCL